MMRVNLVVKCNNKQHLFLDSFHDNTHDYYEIVILNG